MYAVNARDAMSIAQRWGWAYLSLDINRARGRIQRLIRLPLSPGPDHKQEGMFLLTCVDSFLQVTLMVWKLYIKSMQHFENLNVVFYAIYRWRTCGKDNDSAEYHLPEKLASIH